MKILGILGSPRRGGNAESLLDQALSCAKAGGAETEKIVLNELRFVPCQECGGCDQTGICVYEDDMQMIYKKVKQAQAVIIAAPIFFGSLPAQVKAMIDRHQCRWIEKFVLKKEPKTKPKPGYLILVSGSNREKFFQNAESIVKNFFSVAGITFKQSLYCPGIDAKAKILEHLDYLKQASALVKLTS